MGNPVRRSQSGFTLVEVLIVSAIIGILASVAMPEYRSYQARVKVSEAMLAFSNCRNTIHEVYLTGNDRPAENEWGCETDKPSKYVFGVTTTDEGIVKLQLGSDIGDLRLALAYITIAPLNSSGGVMREEDVGSPVRRWRCGSRTDGTDLNTNYLPSSCRG